METSSSNPARNLSPETRKLFVGRINESIKEEDIREHFENFGEVRDVVVVKDRATGIVRGFGFVEFVDRDSAERALNEKEHAIGGRTMEVRRARPRGELRRNSYPPSYQYSIFSEQENNGLSSNITNSHCIYENPAKSKKIFVGGLSSSITEDEFRSYFEKFGRITDVVIMYDSSTHRPRGFGFITFDSVEAVDYALQRKFHELNNKTVEVKVAVPKDSNIQNNFGGANCSMQDGRGPALTNHQKGYYPPYYPRYGYYPSYAPSPVPGFFYGTTGYSIGPYNGFNYGASFARSPWNAQVMAGTMRSPSPYNTSGYPSYFGGYLGESSGAGGYYGHVWSNNEKLNQSDVDARVADQTTEVDAVTN